MIRLGGLLLALCWAAPAWAWDTNVYARLLQEHVRQGQVDYAALKAREPARLDQLYASLQSADAGSTNLAFWINAYNLVVLREVTRAWPVKDVWAIDPKFFQRPHPIAGRQLSLDQLEKQIIGPRFAEPRIHFALNCAARSCPPLASEPYRPETLDAQLTERTRRFLNDDAHVRFDPNRGRLSVSRLFEWYAADFKGTESFLERYLDEPRRQLLRSRRWPIEYLAYDWSVNAVP